MILKNNISNQLYVLRNHFKGGILMFMVLPFFKFQEAIVVIFILFYLFVSLPIIYLHLTYYFANRNCEITIDANELTIHARGKTTVLKKTDFSNITYCKLTNNLNTGSWSPMYGGSIPYNYIKIITNQGGSIIITSLMHKNLDDVINQFRDIPIKRTTNIFFIPRKNMLPLIDELH